jgi:hypothetical protein
LKEGEVYNVAFNTLPYNLAIFIIVIAIQVFYQILKRINRKLFHFPAPAFVVFILDSDFCRWIQPPEVLLSRAGIQPGLRVLETGCSSGGYNTFTSLPKNPYQHRALPEVRRMPKPKGGLAVSELLLDPDYPLWSSTIRKKHPACSSIPGP